MHNLIPHGPNCQRRRWCTEGYFLVHPQQNLLGDLLGELLQENNIDKPITGAFITNSGEEGQSSIDVNGLSSSNYSYQIQVHPT